MLRSFQVLGNVFRESGAALERLGCVLQGSRAAFDPLMRNRPIMGLYDKIPNVKNDVFVAPSASVQGDVTIGTGSSIWYGAVIRGDTNNVVISNNVSVHDRVVIVSSNPENTEKTTIGENVSIGAGSVLDQCKIGSHVEIGPGSRVLSGVQIESFSIIAPGSCLAAGTVVPANEFWEGNPAKFKRAVTETEKSQIAANVAAAANRASLHAAETNKSWAEIARDAPQRIADPKYNFDPSKLGVLPEDKRTAW